MKTPKGLLFCAVLGVGLTGCNVQQDTSVTSVIEECKDLVNKQFIGQNGPEVCVTTPLSKSATSITGTIVGTATLGPFMVTALTSDGTILKQVTTLANGDFTMTPLNLQNLPGKGISFSVFVNGVSSPPTKLVVGQEPSVKCSEDLPGFSMCGTYPGAIFFPIKTSTTTVFSLHPGDTFGGATLHPPSTGLGGFINWKPDRTIAYQLSVALLQPGDEPRAYAENRNNESFAYPVSQTVLANKKQE
ncbi:hypothetical protein [Pseudomonas sp. IT-P291]|uniref:hypothetical protein n=1 Tax=Pseudomonas sp. IT-P291 TaxID=3026448 RepID=UPI0039E14911